ncbi:DUF6461 domain-containing protein [Microbispora sp. CA-135349]|uniref:DUF6461 domain-containing protein n=1 Tax=Microbispora sp. CA-135349 TaxID=3239953 RepID=UPI003D944634
MARVEETRGCCDIIGVRRLAGWTVAYEYCGWEGARTELQRELSRDGGEAVTVCRHDYGHDRFSYSVDGELVTSFDPMFPEDRWGAAPDRLLSDMAELGLDPDRAPGEPVANRIAAALALAGRVSGVLVSEDDLTWPMLGARITTRVPDDPAVPWRRGPKGGSGT